jgi:hypothetical protein
MDPLQLWRGKGVVHLSILCKGIVVLYFGGKYFACRGCCNLTYRSCNETAMDRKYRRSNDLRRRIGAKPGCFDSLPIFKPKGMHQVTWNRIRLEIQHLEKLGWKIMGQRLGIAEHKLD